MTEHTTRRTHKSFIMIPPNQDTATPDKRASRAVDKNAVPSDSVRIAANGLLENSAACCEELLEDAKCMGCEV